ncbi:unnamed protein product, partial [Natator depressus]
PLRQGLAHVRGATAEETQDVHQKNTLNPSYNEALVFDIPHESTEHVSLTITVMDYDCIGHNEVIGMCRVGSDAEGPGREHWAEMLANPRKPIEHWHQLVEEKALNSYISKSAQRDKTQHRGGEPSPRTSPPPRPPGA